MLETAIVILLTPRKTGGCGGNTPNENGSYVAANEKLLLMLQHVVAVDVNGPWWFLSAGISCRV